ncbi:MAG TPA: endonuclease/exonuclease/phosphatase family protein [Pusillimonas sp.]|uniref:endonuclease/exonuclease/phosphatase family protein n=1 Tax=unclassified Pusillimonas TaxID=2640016 RepID=UPI0026050CC4|nr:MULTISPECIES: endonuclease/exonuclease/phosphatase family protein [unclassified Pusillimonas]HLU18772.1 endonuclease/exonuclease/phosphatase family protein [Pusillimonas sp.]
MSILRIVSYNIHKGRSAIGSRESLSQLRLGLYGLQPDLLFLQEVQGRNERQGILHAQHESLGAALDMQYCYGCNAIRPYTDHGNALLSRYDILHYENQDISDHKLEQRGLLHATIMVDETQVHCLVVHLGLFAGGRTRQIMALVDRIKRMVPDHAPMIIAGDFNDWTNRLAPLFVEQLGLYEVFAVSPQGLATRSMPLHHTVRHLGRSLRRNRLAQSVHELGINGMARMTPPPRTFPSAFPWLRLDRIYQRGFAVRKARVLHGRPWRQLSDHSPIFAELELP